jgi:superfamily II DNA/RNA helicase
LAVTSLQAKKNLRGFADGTVNLLITTVVAEEGMDVPAANCVLRFDPMLNSVSLVQGRGRARHANSSFIVLSERPDRPTNRLVEAEHQQLEIVRNFQPQMDDTLSVTSASSNAPEEFKTLVDRMRWKVQYEYEQLSEQAFRARAVLFKSEGDSDREADREELPWSPASGSKQKAKHAAAEMGLSACSACSRTQPPPNSSPAAASATSAPTELQVLQVLVDRREESCLGPRHRGVSKRQNTLLLRLA